MSDELKTAMKRAVYAEKTVEHFKEQVNRLEAENAALREKLTYIAEFKDVQVDAPCDINAQELGEEAFEALQQPSTAYERYKAMVKIVEAAKKWRHGMTERVGNIGKTVSEQKLWHRRQIESAANVCAAVDALEALDR